MRFVFLCKRNAMFNHQNSKKMKKRGTGDESVEFESGSDYVFEIGGTFTLGKNVKIKPGARLLVKPTDINY